MEEVIHFKWTVTEEELAEFPEPEIVSSQKQESVNSHTKSTSQDQDELHEVITIESDFEEHLRQIKQIQQTLQLLKELGQLFPSEQ